MATVNKCKKCGCEDKALTSPAPCPTPIGCPDPIPCSEIFDAQCVLYTQDPILCGTDVIVNTNTVVSDALNNIIDYFCSKLTVTTDLTCGDITVVPADTSLVDALALVVDYFCQNSGGSITVLQEGTGIDITSVTVGDTTTYTVGLAPVPAKVFFYQQVISDINIVPGAPAPGPDNYFYPIGYNILQYTNTGVTSKTFKVFVSYDTNVPNAATNTADFSNWVDGAIIKTVGITDTVLWQSLGAQDLAGALMDGPTAGDVVSFVTTEKVFTSPGTLPVEFRFYNTRLPRNVSFYQVVTLAPNETVSLKFKSKSGSDGRLLQAQIMVEEI